MEKYYWTKEDGTKIPVHELTDLHICNIVMRFGKDNLRNMGHSVIADRFVELNKKHKFFGAINVNVQPACDGCEYELACPSHWKCHGCARMYNDNYHRKEE